MKKKIIVLVEDNPAHRELIKESLKDMSMEFEIVTFDDGEKAKDGIPALIEGSRHQGKVFVVLLDIKLPGMNGLEVLSALRTNETTKTLPVIMLTSSSRKEDIEKSYILGANSYVVKPDSFGEMLSKIQSIPSYWFGVSENPGGE